MKILFHLNNLSFRGTTTAILDYAKYNQELLGNESYFAFNKSLLNSNNEIDCYKDVLLDTLYKNYNVLQYENLIQLKSLMDYYEINHIYSLKYGIKDDLYVEGKQNLNHVVFNVNQPHGEKYVYVSEWLSNINNHDYVPHIVQLPKEQLKSYRKELNIPDDYIVFGRYGGYDQFDIEFVKKAVIDIVEQYDNVMFLFINTRPFVNHKNVKFLPAIFTPQEKSDFILSCDTMIHARSDGESFGLSICEFLFHNKPTFSYAGGRDKNNVLLLNNTGLLYNNYQELISKMFSFINTKSDYDYSKLVDEFVPEKVMKKFEKVFLE